MKNANLSNNPKDPSASLLSDSQEAFLVANSYVVQRIPTRGFRWISATPGNHLTQGFKLRVNLSAVSARRNIEAILPILVRHQVEFKLPEDLSGLLLINSGQAGRSQIGKGLTVYCSSMDVIQSLSQDLKSVLVPPFAPCPPSDTKIDEGLSFREAIFTTTFKELDSGLTVRTDLSGAEKDKKAPGTRITLNDKPFLILRDLGGLRNQSSVAVDLNDIRPVFIKRAARGVGEEKRGSDSYLRLEHEIKVISEVRSSIVPELIEVSKDGSELTVVLEYFEGIPPLTLSASERLRYLKELIRTLRVFHQQGWIHRDLKVANTIFTREGVVKLIDFEVSTTLAETGRFDLESRGYSPVGHMNESGPKVDVYSIGKIIFHLATGIDPGLIPTQKMFEGLLEAYPMHKNVRELIKICTSPDSSDRPNLEEIEQRLNGSDFTLYPDIPIENWCFNNFHSLEESRLEASRISEIIQAWRRIKKDRSIWRNTHLFPDYEATGLNLGLSGLIFALIYLTRLPTAGGLKHLLGEMVENVLSKDTESISPGLFTGLGSQTLALALVANRNSDSRLFDRALARFEKAVDKSRLTDFFSGDAGLIYLGAFLHEITQYDNHQRKLKVLVEPLVKRLLQHLSTSFGQDQKNSNQKLGFAHGAAGEALALKIWARSQISVNVSIAMREAISQEVDRIFVELFHNYWDERAAKFQISQNPGDGLASNEIWCHGAMGICHALLLSYERDTEHFLNQYGLSEKFSRVLDEVLNFRSVDNPSLCHGVSGRIDFLMTLQDLDLPFVDRERLSKLIQSHLALLETMKIPFTSDSEIGKVIDNGEEGEIWTSDMPNLTTPDLWVGFLGPIVTIQKWRNKDFASILSHNFWKHLAGL